MVGPLNETGPGDASVLRPVPGRMKGLAAAIGCNPWFAEADPYRGGMAAIDEACRNIVAVGARPDAFTDCLNFGNPEKPERLGEFREAVRGLGEAARGLGLPIPSGNVSLYNEAPGGHHILPTPMILGCGLIDDVRKCITADFKRLGSIIMVVGETRDEMGGSLLFRKFGGEKGEVPETDIPRLKRLMDELLQAMDEGLVISCHDCSDGGIAVAVAEMCISGHIGAEIDTSAMPGEDFRVKLYSESCSRWIVEVDGADVSRFMQVMNGDAFPLGITKGDRLLIKDNGTEVSLDEMIRAWSEPVWNIMGGKA